MYTVTNPVLHFISTNCQSLHFTYPSGIKWLEFNTYITIITMHCTLFLLSCGLWVTCDTVITLNKWYSGVLSLWASPTEYTCTEWAPQLPTEQGLIHVHGEFTHLLSRPSYMYRIQSPTEQGLIHVHGEFTHVLSRPHTCTEWVHSPTEQALIHVQNSVTYWAGPHTCTEWVHSPTEQALIHVQNSVTYWAGSHTCTERVHSPTEQGLIHVQSEFTHLLSRASYMYRIQSPTEQGLIHVQSEFTHLLSRASYMYRIQSPTEQGLIHVQSEFTHLLSRASYMYRASSLTYWAGPHTCTEWVHHAGDRECSSVAVWRSVQHGHCRPSSHTHGLHGLSLCLRIRPGQQWHHTSDKLCCFY